MLKITMNGEVKKIKTIIVAELLKPYPFLCVIQKEWDINCYDAIAILTFYSACGCADYYII